MTNLAPILALVLLTLAVLAPLALALRWQAATRSRRDSALAIHRLQLVELDRDLADGRIDAGEHATALLEVQRRLLAAADTPADSSTGRASRAPLLAALALVPLLAAGLYALDGHPFLPAAPLAARRAAANQDGPNQNGANQNGANQNGANQDGTADQNGADQDAAGGEALIARLRDQLAGMDQRSELARQGYILLGNAEHSRGRLAAAAAAWRQAVDIRFDAALAALAAEAQTRVAGTVSPDSATLFRRALATAPPDAAWRQTAEHRLAEAAKQQQPD